MVQLIGLNGIDLLRALVEQIRDKGSYPFVQIEDTETQRLLVEKGDTGFWQNQASVDQLPKMEKMDVFIGIRASTLHEQHGLDYTEHADSGYPEFQASLAPRS